MKQYKLVNNLVGWLAFVIAAYTYCMTIEPTASFWDCPEFITTGYKLEVGHPPGAPFFMLTANLFSQFTSDPSQVARMVNTMSALMSAACILFLFWSITHLVKKLICPDDKEMTLGKLITIMGSGLVGHLLVQCRRRRGIRLLQPLHRSRILVDFKMGIRCQRASQRPLAGSDCLPDRTFHRCALAELIVYSGHCTGVLL